MKKFLPKPTDPSTRTKIKPTFENFSKKCDIEVSVQHQNAFDQPNLGSINSALGADFALVSLFSPNRNFKNPEEFSRRAKI